MAPRAAQLTPHKNWNNNNRAHVVRITLDSNFRQSPGVNSISILEQQNYRTEMF